MKILMLFFLLITILTTGCAHYGPVSMGQGEPSNKEVESCNYLILGFPINAKATRIDTALRAKNLRREDIFSIERSYWPYLFPIVMPDCLVFSLNKKAAKSYTGGKAIIPPKKPSLKEQEPDEEFSHIKSMKQCDREFTGLYRSNCRRAVYDRIRKNNSK